MEEARVDEDVCIESVHAACEDADDGGLQGAPGDDGPGGL